MKDLLVVVADSNMESLMQGLLPRLEKTGDCCSFTFHIERYAGKNDTGFRNQLVPFLNTVNARSYRRLLVLFDFEGAGIAASPAHAAEEILDIIDSNGYSRESSSIVIIEPECDAWMWVNRSKMKEVIRSRTGSVFPEDVDGWLAGQGFLFDGQKPVRPKEALELLTAHLNVRRSSALYKSLASQASYKHCTDPAFLRMMETLRQWFPVHASQ